MTKRIALAGSILLLAAPLAAAQAADLIIDTPAAVATASATDWTGAYVGIHGSLAWGDVGPDWDTAADIDGQLAGIQAGYNVQVDNFVLGIEGDVSWSNLGFENSNLPDWESSYSVDWLATLRARAGISLDKVLLYATAGLAAGGATFDVYANYFDEELNDDVVIDGASTQTHIGWVVGAGIEAMVADGISLKAEYLYRDLGSATYTIDTDPPIDLNLRASTFTIGANFHF